MKTINVNFEKNPYPIFVGHNCLAQAAEACGWSEGRRAFVIVDENLQQYGQEMETALVEAGWPAELISISAQETDKTFENVNEIHGKLLEVGATRHSVVFAVGGGVLTDVIGFVAATFMRGVAWVVVPTTLLGMVDSAIGGKTAINHVKAKNAIGAFHQPDAVIVDSKFLESLPKRERVSGLGEIIKYGITFDEPFFTELEQNYQKIIDLDPEFISHAIATSAAHKSRVVAEDEFDKKGVREVLNFGHTIGHALEKIGKYKTYRHGEAVIWGMAFAAALSVVKGHLSEEDFTRVYKLLKRMDIPPLPKNLTLKQLTAPLKFDKKNTAQGVRFVLLKGVGETKLQTGIAPEEIGEVASLLGIKLKGA